MSDLSTLIIWMVWGKNHVDEAAGSVASVSNIRADRCLITDADTAAEADFGGIFDQIVVADFDAAPGHLRKSEMWHWIPEGYDVYLFLDSDTRVIGDISFGFEQAMKYGVAMVPAAHYCLDYYWGFDRVMKLAGIEPRGQIQYNSGVIFFTRTPEVERLFARWNQLASQFGGSYDQSFLTLAMELNEFRPYVLSPNYNYRGMHTLMIGDIRIWHSHEGVPARINAEPDWWPMRSFGDGKLRHPRYIRSMVKKLVKRVIGRT